MERVGETEIRHSMVNCTKGEASGITLPAGLAGLDWGAIDVLGWRDGRAPQRGYLVTWRDGAPLGVVLRAADSRMSRARAAVCMLCRSGRPADAVSLFTARRAGAAGRAGNTVGTYLCADLSCAHNVRLVKGSASLQLDPGLSTEEKIAGLRQRLDAFLTEVLRA
jgi:FBP C-terminal treble-clef zinc-finger